MSNLPLFFTYYRLFACACMCSSTFFTLIVLRLLPVRVWLHG